MQTFTVVDPVLVNGPLIQLVESPNVDFISIEYEDPDVSPVDIEMLPEPTVALPVGVENPGTVGLTDWMK